MQLLSLLPLLPLTLAAPSSRAANGGSLSCVIQQYVRPFTDTGFNGFIELYANVTVFDPDSQTNRFNETRLGLADDGTIQNCGDCRSSQQFGFEVCEGPERKGFNGLGNSPKNFYGHLLYTTNQADIQCLTASQPFNGSSITVSDCQSDYDNAGASGQYFKLSVGDDGTTIAQLVTSEAGQFYGVNPDIGNEGGKLTLWSGPPSAPFTYLGFKAREI